MPLALFDLDNTLIRGDSAQAWARFLVERGLVNDDHFLPRNRAFMEDYEHGRLDLAAYIHHNLSPFLGCTNAQLQPLVSAFMASVLEAMILPAGEQLIRHHRDAGDPILIISATVAFLVEPIARRLRADHFIAVDVEMPEGRFDGRIRGIPSFREGKLSRLLAWLGDDAQAQLHKASFYSDSRNDLPLLEAVGRPVAVDPDAVLRATALARGWEVLTLRS